LAGVFHWPLSDIEALTVPELLAWHEAAVDFLARQGRIID
jgi:hypothetical protein